MNNIQHRKSVVSLYRALLKQAYSWNTGSRENWFSDVLKIREAFRSNIEETNPRRLSELLTDGQRLLGNIQHPDLYRFPEDEGGAVFQRNLPPPEFLVHHNAGYGEWEVPAIEKIPEKPTKPPA